MNDMKKLMEAIAAIEEDNDWGMPDAEFDSFVQHLTSISSTREQLRTLYLWIKAEKGLTEADFIDLAEYITES